MQAATDEEVFKTFGRHVDTCLGESLPKADQLFWQSFHCIPATESAWCEAQDAGLSDSRQKPITGVEAVLSLF